MPHKVAIIRASYKGSEPVVEDTWFRAIFQLGRVTDWECKLFSVARRTAQVACNHCLEWVEKDEKENGHRFTHVIYMDDDVTVDGDTFIKLVNAVDIVHPAVFALAFFRTAPFRPAIFEGIREDGGKGRTISFKSIVDYPENDWIQVDASGLCAAAFDREVFAMIDKPYFDWGMEGKNAEQYTPDGFLCNKLAEKGIRLYCHTGIRVGHLGVPYIINEAQALPFKEQWICDTSSSD